MDLTSGGGRQLTFSENKTVGDAVEIELLASSSVDVGELDGDAVAKELKR